MAGDVGQVIDLTTGKALKASSPVTETAIAALSTPDAAAPTVTVVENSTVVEAPAAKAKGGKIRFRNMVDTARGEKGGEMIFLVAERFRPLGHNIRDWTLPDNIAAIREIAATFDLTSSNPDDHVREPIVVLQAEDGMLEIEKGETRWRAVLLVEGQEFAPNMKEPALVAPGTIKIPCVKGNPNRTLLQRRVETVTQVGRRPNDLEIARLFVQLHKPVEEGGEGMSQSEIADAIHKPGQQTYVSQIMALLKPEVDPRLHEAMLAGRIKSTTIVNTYRDFSRSGEPPAKATEVMLETVAEAIAADEADSEKAPETTGRNRPARPRRATATAINRKTGHSIVQSAKPRAHTKVNFEIMREAVEYAAQYSSTKKVRDEMNKALKKAGFYDLPCLVDDAGEELPNAAAIMERHKKNVRRRAA